MVPTEYTGDGLQGAVAASRLSHVMGLRGPSVSYDTACSSALMAFGFALWRMKDAEDPLPAAIAGGVNLHMTPHRYVGLGSGGFLTKNGRCFTFDQSAEGYLRGEGCGSALMVLKGSEAHHTNCNVIVIICCNITKLSYHVILLCIILYDI